MSEDYQSGKFEDGLILPEEKFSKSVIVACGLPVAGLSILGLVEEDYAQPCHSYRCPLCSGIFDALLHTSLALDHHGLSGYLHCYENAFRRQRRDLPAWASRPGESSRRTLVSRWVDFFLQPFCSDFIRSRGLDLFLKHQRLHPLRYPANIPSSRS